MVGGKGPHKTTLFLQRLRLRRALGIQSSHGMRPASRSTRGRDRRCGTWWDRELNCITIEGQDFAQDTQEGGADRFEFIPDSDEEGGDNGLALLGGDDEFMPQTEPQDIVAVSRSGGPCNNHGRPRFSTMLHDWQQIIHKEEQQCASQIAKKEQKELTACSKEEDHKGNAKEENQKVEKEHNDNTNDEFHEKATFSDMETDDEASWVVDGVDLRGHSQVEEDSWVVDGVDLRGHSQVEEDSSVQDGEDDCSHVEGDDFKDKVNELIIALFPAYREVLRSAKR